MADPPRFVNAEAGDYTLRADSPCLDKGSLEVQSIYTSDLRGYAHWDQDGNSTAEPDLGAYELYTILPQVTPAELVVYVAPGGAATGSLTVANTRADITLPYTVSESSPWLTLGPGSGSLVGAQAHTVTLTNDATSLSEGIYPADITVTASGSWPGIALEPVTVPLTLRVDASAPSVTIDQAASQADPAAGVPIHFTAVFSEPVYDFTAADVALDGTAGATTAVVTGGPEIFDVAVSGMTGNGTVIASIPAGAVHDPLGHPNSASTSTDNSVTLVRFWCVAPDGDDTRTGKGWDQSLATISNAVDRANAGDEILISNGLYRITEQIAVNKAVTLSGFGGTRDAVIVARDPEATNRIFLLDGGAVIQGLSILDGLLWATNLPYAQSLFGAGVHMSNAVLRDCVIANCVLSLTHSNLNSGGGGIYMNHTDARVENCVISNNAYLLTTVGTTGNGSHRDGGGGIFLDRGTVSNCLIEGNIYDHFPRTMSGHGGGAGIIVFGNGGMAYVFDTIIRSNRIINASPSWGGGGGVRMGWGVMEDCEISSNSAPYKSGGMHLCADEGAGGKVAYVRRCRFLGNTGTASQGNHLYLVAGQDVRFENCLFADGQAAAPAIVIAYQAVTAFRNCTIATGANEPSAVSLDYLSSIGNSRFVNCILYPNGPIYNKSATNAWPVFDFCCATNLALIAPDADNITADPRFADPAELDFQLRIGSPCADAGSSALVDSYYTTDLLGNPHFDYDRDGLAEPDMGCFELQERSNGSLIMVR